jgi:hypothetical protein
MSGLGTRVVSLLGLLLGLNCAVAAHASELESGSREILTPPGWEPATPACAATSSAANSSELLTPDSWNDGRTASQACCANSAYSELVVPAAWARTPRPARAF